MEGFACLEKQEKLALYTEGGKLKELVLQDVDPYPGYYSETPGIADTGKPKYIFAILKQSEGCYEDFVLRAACKLRNIVDYEFEMNYGRLSVLNKHLPCVRFKLYDLSKTLDLLEKLKAEEIEFEKSFFLKPYKSVIKVRKYLTLTEYTKNIYAGTHINHYYFAVPEKLKWSDFVEMIVSIRGSGEFNSFDAAQISLYGKNDIKEFIRIYTEDFSKEDFCLFREKVLNYLDKFE